jgi:photosystem II stability/assembly factor-like uncharacterized protein
MFKKILNKLSTFLFYLSILIFIIAFNFQHNPPGGWYQQFLPSLNGQPLSDVIFLDSLTGFAITDNNFSNDTGYILRTTNGGDNWDIVFSSNRDYKAIDFININTGYVCGAQPSTGSRLLKTTNSGLNWFDINPPDPFLVYDDMSVLNEDTIWLVASSGFDGGVFRTTNGGASWQQQLNLGSQNPNTIYMFNARIGFIAKNTSNAYVRKTTNGGLNWLTVINEGFTDMYFVDSLTGWKCWYELDSIKKTIDGGINWIKLLLPPTGGFYNLSAIRKFSFINKDTVWGAGARASTSLGFRGLIYKSTNGGQTWGYQLPDSSTINIGRYFHIDFTNKLNGWAYANSSTGVHTKIGGDTTYYTTTVNQIISAVPSDYKLYQNYPNPFNPLTKIKYELKTAGFVKLKVFNVEGREIKTIVNEKQNAGVYEADFSATEYGSTLSTGVYFYSLFADYKFVDTKKMIVIK